MPDGATQELQAVASGQVFNYPVVLSAYARRRVNRSSDLTDLQRTGSDWVGSSGVFGAGAAWFYRGIGLYCDRDGTPGYQDPNDNTGCDAVRANQDCLLGAVTAQSATWQNVDSSNSSDGFKYWTDLKDQSQLYEQKCYFKGNTDADQSQGAYTLKDGSIKCDITIDKLAVNGAWVPSTPNANVWALGSLSSACPVTNQYIGLQIWVFAGSVSTGVSVVDTSNSRISLDGATDLNFVKTVTCTYEDSSTQTANVVADTRVVSNPFANSWNGVTLTRSVGRINFGFQCPRSNNGKLLNKISWDPEVNTNPANTPIAASSLTFSAALVALLLIIATLW